MAYTMFGLLLTFIAFIALQATLNRNISFPNKQTNETKKKRAFSHIYYWVLNNIT